MKVRAVKAALDDQGPNPFRLPREGGDPDQGQPTDSTKHV